jgi:hypothetical protein
MILITHFVRGKRPSGDPGRPKQGGCRLFASLRTATSLQRAGRSRSGADDNRLSKFKRLVDQCGKGRWFAGTSTQSIFALGLEILDNVQDAGVRQEVIATLASEQGLSCIRDVAANGIPLVMTGSIDAKLKIWETEVCPLFRLFVHSTFVSSTLLEKVAVIL